MKQISPLRSYVRLIVFAAVTVFTISGLTFTGVVSAAGFFGAIFTSLGNGTAVNMNIYASKPDVYLNGGPQNMMARGLPDGIYFFQVTTPSGGSLLSEDNAECRQVTVALGKFAGATGPCPHANGTANAANGSLPVQLVPFADTDNPGGVYKVWLIAQTPGTSVDLGDPRVIHFNNSDSKTDNFKVLDFCDLNPNDPLCQPEPDVFSLDGSKFFDINGNGVRNVDDFPLAGFQIRTTVVPPPGGMDILRFTVAPTGTWSIIGILDGTDYYVREDVPAACNAPAGSYWQQTAPSSLTTPPGSMVAVRGYEGTITNANVTGLDFGNRCLRNGTGGFTLGFWSNRNGAALYGADDAAMLAALNLRNAAGAHFDPTSNHSAFKSWLLSANATNMAYMLSAQMAATSLNVHNGFIDGNALLDVGGQIGTINGWRTEANNSLGSFGNTTSPHAERAAQERLKNIFDAINNNNFLFIQTGCTACYGP